MEGLLKQLPIARELGECLTPLEYITLRQAAPHRFPCSVYALVLTRLEQNLHRRYPDARYSDFIAVFMHELRTNRSLCLTGGALLSTLNGDDLTADQDFDVVVVPSSPTGLTRQDLHFIGNALAKITDLNAFMHCLSRLFNDANEFALIVNYTSPPGPLHDQFSVTIKPCNGLKVQLLVYESYASALCAIQSFDLSFCANAIGALCGGLVVHDMSAVRTRECCVDLIVYVRQKLAHILSVQANGQFGYAANVVIGVFDRLKKYARRGYTINILHDPDATCVAFSGGLTVHPSSLQPCVMCEGINIGRCEVCDVMHMERAAVNLALARRMQVSRIWNESVLTHMTHVDGNRYRLKD